LTASVQDTSFFQSGDEINFTKEEQKYIKNNHEFRKFNNLVYLLGKYIIEKDEHEKDKHTFHCEYKECSPKFKFDETLGYATIINPIRTIKFYQILKPQDIFSLELKAEHIKLTINYNCKQLFEVTGYIRNDNHSMPNEGFINQANRINNLVTRYTE